MNGMQTQSIIRVKTLLHPCSYCQTHRWDLQDFSFLVVPPVVVVELQQHGCVYSFTVILLGHAVWPCGEHRHKMLYKYRPQHWLSVSALLSAQAAVPTSETELHCPQLACLRVTGISNNQHL